MKRLFYLLSASCVLMTLSFTADARRIRELDSDWFPRSEIYIQYGTPTLIELTSTLSKFRDIYGMNELYYSGESRNYVFTGVPAIGYKFSINERWAVGAYIGASMAKSDLWLTKVNNVELPEAIRLYYSEVWTCAGMLDASILYWEEGTMSLSGQVYLGVAFQDEKISVYDEQDKRYRIPGENDRWRFAYHITPMKFRIGDVCGFFAELGFGYRGLVNAGFSARF